MSLAGQNDSATGLQLSQPLLEALTRMRCGGVMLNENGSVVRSNMVAERLLEDEFGPRGDSDRAAWTRSRIKDLLRRADRFRLEGHSWAVIPRQDKRPLALHSVPSGNEADPHSVSVIVLIDLNLHVEPAIPTLQYLFDLTPAEANLAVKIARGRSPIDVAREHNVTMPTIRTQLGAIYAKTQTRRQSELVALLARVAILP